MKLEFAKERKKVPAVARVYPFRIGHEIWEIVSG